MQRTGYGEKRQEAKKQGGKKAAGTSSLTGKDDSYDVGPDL
jgi:hypothetical protein